MNLSWLVVVVIYVLGVALARRCGAGLPRRIAALFFVLVLTFLWRPLTQQVVIVPADVIRLVEPWTTIQPPVTKYDVSNMNLHDVPMQIVPWMHQVRESWLRGEVPLWNATSGCGYPLMANGQSTPFSPFILLTLPLPLGYAITAQAALKLLLALVLTYLFCRLRWSQRASAIAAIAYGFSTWMLVWLQFPIATASALLPGVILGIECVIPSGARDLGGRGAKHVPVAPPAQVPRSARDDKPARLAFAVFMFAITVLSGHPETVYNLGLIAALHGLWIANVRGLVRVIGACALAALIAAPYLVPFYEAMTRSQRFVEMTAPRNIATPFSDRPSWTLLIAPRFFGEVPVERAWGPAVLESLCGFAGVLALASIVAAAILVIRDRKWRSIETCYLLGAILCFGIVLDWSWLTHAFHAVAGLAPAMRMRLGICWFAAILIAPAIDDKRRWPLLAGVVVVAAMMFWLWRTTWYPVESYRPAALLSMMPSFAVLIAIALSAFRRELIVVAGALTFIELAVTMRHWNPTLPARELNPRLPLIVELEQRPGVHRFVGMGGQLYPATNALFGLEDVRVHDPMASARYVEYLAKNAGWNPADYYAKLNDPESWIFDRLNVKYVVTQDGRIVENAGARERFYSDAAEVQIKRVSDVEYRLHIRARQQALIASSITSYPGWTAGDFRVVEHDGPFLAFTVPPGEHDVTVKYRPRSFYWSLIPSALATAFVLGQMLRARRLRRSPS